MKNKELKRFASEVPSTNERPKATLSVAKAKRGRPVNGAGAERKGNQRFVPQPVPRLDADGSVVFPRNVEGKKLNGESPNDDCIYVTMDRFRAFGWAVPYINAEEANGVGATVSRKPNKRPGRKL